MSIFTDFGLLPVSWEIDQDYNDSMEKPETSESSGVKNTIQMKNSLSNLFFYILNKVKMDSGFPLGASNYLQKTGDI